MSRRNLILLIIVLILLMGFLFWFLSFYQNPSQDKGEEPGFFQNLLNPFGQTKVTPPPITTPPIDLGETPPSSPNETEKSRLEKVSSLPIAGFIVFQKEKTVKEFVPALRYVDRATGNVYQTFIDEIKEEKLSETVIPKISEAFFGNKGETVVMRYLKTDERTIQTFVGNLPKEKLGEIAVAGDKELTGSFLPDNITDLSVSLDTTKIFYLFNADDNAYGIIFDLKNNKKTQVFDSPFTEWLSAWGGNNLLTINTKASGSIPGYLYEIDLNKKTLSKITGNINGLTTLPSQNGKMILLSNNNLSLSIYDTESRETKALGLRTQTEKCIWEKDNEVVYCAVPKNIEPGLYPDAWYQGEVSFNDQIWKINTQNGIASLVLDPISLNGGEEIDGIKLALDEKENYLFFVNKKDSSLWKFDLL